MLQFFSGRHLFAPGYLIFNFLMISVCFHAKLNAQGMYTNFGQNRVQYNRFEWSFVRSENFDAFFYSGGRELGTFAARSAEDNLNAVENLVDHRLSGRIEIICYNSLSDYKQANFGLTETPGNTGGYSQVVNNKVFIYFDGNREHFLQQIKSGIALVLINELLFGGSLQERIQNAALLNLPDWYLFGLTNYIGEDWNVDLDNRMKDVVLSKKVKKFNRFVQKDPELAGRAFWRFLVDKYGVEVIAQMIYVTRLTRNYESALVYVTGVDLKQTLKDWLRYYEDQYAKEDVNRSMPLGDFKLKRRLRPYVEKQMRVGPKGDYITFTTNHYGKYKVWLVNTQTSKTKRIHRGGLKYDQKIYDHSFPILAWHPGGEKFSYVHERRGKVWITTYNILTKKKETIPFLKFDKITSLSYSDNGSTLVLSAIRKGQSDLYVFDMKSRKERQLTNDPADDLYPRFTDGGSKIIFSSNRISDSLGTAFPVTLKAENNLDIFIYDFASGERVLKRLTKTENIDEIEPLEYNNQYYAYLTEYNGIENRYAAKIETVYDYTELQINYKDTTLIDTLNFEVLENKGSVFVYNGKTITLNDRVSKIDTIVHMKDIVYTYPITNYSRSILAHDVCRQTQKTYDLMLENNRYHIRHAPLVNNMEEEAKKTETYPNMFRLKSGFAKKPFNIDPVVFSKKPIIVERIDIPVETPKKQAPLDSNTYFFISDYTPKTYKPEMEVEEEKKQQSLPATKAIKIAAPRFYDVTFFNDYFVTQLDNSVINTYYQPITPSGENLFNPGLNGMIKLGMVDLFEDYRLTGGFRVPMDLSGIDYFLQYETLKRRLDQKLTFYRQVRSGVTQVPGSVSQNPVKSLSHELRYTIKYPFNPVWSLRFQIFIRQDHDIFQATNQQSLEFPDAYKYWSGGKAELVFDNTIPKGLNLYNGTRFKIFYERYYNLDDSKVQLNAMGFDFRHYQRIHRQLIFCTRATYNTSFGPAKVKYVLGGVDNALFPVYDNTNNSIGTENFAFQALATNMRGFNQNIRNGSSFAVINTEIRWPVFTYLLNRPIRSDFIGNFQLVPFFDIGTAWIGSDPYSEDNTFNQKIIDIRYLRATVVNVREPIVAGMGGGIHTKLMGYFIRFDTGWGIQDREINKKPVYTFSLSLDF